MLYRYQVSHKYIKIQNGLNYTKLVNNIPKEVGSVKKIQLK